MHSQAWLFPPLPQLGARRVHIEVGRDPVLGGTGEPLPLECIEDIVHRYQGMTDIFILCVDRDGVSGRHQRPGQIEAGPGHRLKLFAENVWEKIETWVLAGLPRPTAWQWADNQAEVQIKEVYFEPYAAKYGLPDLPDGGRKDPIVKGKGVVQYQRYQTQMSRRL